MADCGKPRNLIELNGAASDYHFHMPIDLQASQIAKIYFRDALQGGGWSGYWRKLSSGEWGLDVERWVAYLLSEELQRC